LAILGENGSGKTTLLKTVLNAPEILKSGSWYAINQNDIGYLDQHYQTIDDCLSIVENIKTITPLLSDLETRKLLNDFLFRKNEEAYKLGKELSGGEKARLSLAQISAKTPKLLLLDEITNNIDLETRNHIITVLNEYRGGIIIISHDERFLEQIGVTNFVNL
jgi:ATPase subunit of ABC transporter with duplicated ATPase domains